MSLCLLFVKTPMNVQPNSVPKFVVRRNFFPCGSVKCASASVQKVQMTRSMMNGHEIWVRAGPLDGASLFCVSFDGSEFSSIDASSGFAILVALSFSLISDDEPGVWSTDAKLKMKVGIVSVTAKQHTESRLQDSQSSLDVEMTVCSVVSAHLEEFLREGSILIVTSSLVHLCHVFLCMTMMMRKMKRFLHMLLWMTSLFWRQLNCTRRSCSSCRHVGL